MSPHPITNDILMFVSQLSGPTAYATIVGILIICGFGVPIPEDITLLAAGLLASVGGISLPGAILSGFFGVLVGDASLFFLGRRFGKKVFRLPGFRRIFNDDRVARAEEKIRANGPFICFVARFLPGLRSPIFAMAGALGVKPYVFFCLDGFAALLSVPLWVYVGYWFGSNFDEALRRAEHVQLLVLTAVVVTASSYLTWKLWRRRRLKTLAIATSPLDDRSISPGIAELNQRDRIENRDSVGS